MGSYDKHRDTKFIQQSDVEPPILVTIDQVKEEDVSAENQAEKIRYVIYFREDYKPWAPGFQSLSMIHQINGSGDTDDWPGTRLVLYKDPNVMFGGKPVGGIRCRAPRQQPAQSQVQQPPQEDDIPF